MQFYSPTMLDNEQVVYRDHQHWIVFLPFVGWLIAIYLFYVYAPTVPEVLWLIVIFAVISLLYAYISYATSLYIVTTKRVIMRTGFFSRHSLELFLKKVEGIQVQQSIFGAMLKYGTVTVIGTGGTPDSFNNINSPLKFRRMVQQAISDITGG